jgi:hypothetical protein
LPPRSGLGIPVPRFFILTRENRRRGAGVGCPA